MKCSSCGKPAVYYARYNGRAFCSQHFVRFFLEKVKRNITKHKLIQAGDRIKPEGKVVGRVLSEITETWPIELVGSGENKIASHLSIDEEIAAVIKALSNGKLYETGFEIGNRVFLFRNLKSEEISIYARIKGIKYGPVRDEFRELVTELEEQMPGSVFSFQASFERMGALARRR